MVEAINLQFYIMTGGWQRTAGAGVYGGERQAAGGDIQLGQTGKPLQELLPATLAQPNAIVNHLYNMSRSK